MFRWSISPPSSESKSKSSKKPAESRGKLSWGVSLFHPEDGGDIFFRKSGSVPTTRRYNAEDHTLKVTAVRTSNRTKWVQFASLSKPHIKLRSEWTTASESIRWYWSNEKRLHHFSLVSNHSSVGTAKGYRMDDQDSIPGRGKIFIPPQLGGHQLPIKWMPTALSPG
jgi:hypothetical protein